MTEYDLVIRGGSVVTAAEVFEADVAVSGDCITAVGNGLGRGREEINAKRMLVMPGGIDPHCHIEEVGESGAVQEESFESGSRAALAGGTTSFICFKPQWRGRAISDSAPDYEARAAQSLADYSYHQIITDPTPDVLEKEVPALADRGVRSLKVFLTYDPLRLRDGEFLKVLACARQLGMLVTVHCENYDAIEWQQNALLAAGLTDPLQHAWARPPIVEREAAFRAMALAELVDQPIQIFHVSAGEVANEIARAQARGQRVWAETCTHYLTHSTDALSAPHFEGAKVVCSPALRAPGEGEKLWEAIRAGTIDIVSSDHCGFSFATAKKDPSASSYGQGHASLRPDGTPAFNSIPNGVPGIESRMAVLFTEGVSKGRIDLPAFVRLTSTNAARLFGLGGRKGTLMPGADADIVLWDPEAERTIRAAHMHQAIDYTPWEGYEAKGWPVMTIRRGEIAVRDGEILAAPGSGQFLARGPYDAIRPRGLFPNGFDSTRTGTAATL
jgi:dihydropyrimidinase